MIKDIYIFRHGVANKNIPDVELASLTDVGIAQATELADKISKTNIEAVFTSPIRRCMETIKIALSEKQDIPIITNNNLIEHNHETLISEVRDRCELALKEILATNYESIAISTHCTIVQCILLLLGVKIPEPQNCELFHITFADGKWHLLDPKAAFTS